MVRHPRVAGMFYPGTADGLEKAVDEYLSFGTRPRTKAYGIVVPHAGYVYSAKAAAMTFSSVEIPDTVIVLGPNHTGLGKPVSVMSSGSWEIPGKQVPIDEKLASSILDGSKYAEQDTAAHIREHSIEVQLPFLARLNSAVRFVPVCIATRQIEVLEDLADAVSGALSASGRDILIVASSDMSHYITQSEARHYDGLAIEQIKNMSHAGLMKVVSEEHISMCGAAPVAVTIKACSALGASTAELIHYNTSAETSGDTSQVVGYAGMIIT